MLHSLRTTRASESELYSLFVQDITREGFWFAPLLRYFQLWLGESKSWSILSQGGQVYITGPSNYQNKVECEQQMSLEIVVKYCTV
jgi:hypothetical protein